MNGLLDLIAGVNGSNYRTEVLDVIFHHLSPESLRPPDVPSQFEATARGHIQKIMRERAHCAVLASTEEMHAIFSSHPKGLPQEVVQKIIQHLDDSMLWLKYLVSNTFPNMPADSIQLADPTRARKIFLHLTRDGEALERHITESSAVVDYCVAVWAAVNHRVKEAFYQISASGCPITQSLYALLSNTESAERVFYLLSLPGKKGKSTQG